MSIYTSVHFTVFPQEASVAWLPEDREWPTHPVLAEAVYHVADNDWRHSRVSVYLAALEV